jgi:hypothetical protein
MQRLYKHIRQLGAYTIKWISSNLAIPFWTVGHIHLTLNVYRDIHEIIVSIGLNIVVLIGFILEYREVHKA